MLKLFLRSLELDFKFLKLPLKTGPKISFILKKYFTLIKNIAVGFTPGKSFTKILGQKYYYDDKFGIAFLQSVFVDHSVLGKYIKPDAIIIDIGANAGQFNFFCRHFLKTDKIFSFEPVEKTYELLKKNAGKHCYNYAVSTKRTLDLYIPQLTLMASNKEPSGKSRKEKVSTIKLDDFKGVKTYQQIDLIKIDTEGMEHDVILSGKETTKRSKYLMIEVSMDNLKNLVKTLKHISPDLKLIEKGRKYKDNGHVKAMDILFKVR